MNTSYMKQFGLLGLMIVALGVQAAPVITGEISFNGGAMLNGPAISATAITNVFGPGGIGTGGPVVGTSTGSYTGLGGTVANFSTFTFNPVPGSAFQLWSFNAGGVDYSFQATSVVVNYQAGGFLNLSGTGVAYITNFDPTPGTWTITDTGYLPVLTFNSVAVVPEPSVSVLLLVGGAVLAAYRRRS